MNTQRVPTAIVADDEPRLAAFLVSRLNALWPELVIAGVAANGPEAQALILREAPDIAFLDIRMPGLTGLDVARIAGADVHVVFVTAFDEYALDAFAHAAIDYLLKPVADDRLAHTIARLKERLAARLPPPSLDHVLTVLAQHIPGMANANGGNERLAWVRAAIGANVQLINVADVCYFQANDKYTSVFTATGEALIRTPIREIVDKLDPQKFWQVHRGTIVNLEHIASTTRDLAGRIALAMKSRPEKVTVSRAYAHLFKQM
jgi:DNA-binding LytR/AlgR family response regulator